MTSETMEINTKPSLLDAWGATLVAAVCEHCDWSYLVPEGSLPQRCPHCFEKDLTPFAGQDEELPYTQPPELLLPFTQQPDHLVEKIDQFGRGIPFAPADLTPQNLKSRLRRVYLPLWLVDAKVKATWQAEVGFNYEVVSHQDRFDENARGWTSRQVTEGRVRWEPRLGKLERSYENISAPALEEHAQLRKTLGSYSIQASKPYQAHDLSSAFVRLPNRTPQDAWSDAAPALQAAAGEECRKAAGADHIRQFAWKAEFANQNWTQLLLPLYTTYYLDDEQHPQAVLVHGQTGQMHGSRRASLKRGQRTSLVLLLVALVLFLISLLFTAFSLAMPVLTPLGIIGIVVALFVGLSAIVPIATVTWFNHQQKQAGE